MPRVPPDQVGTEPLGRTDALPRGRGRRDAAFELRVLEGPDLGKSLHVEGSGTRHLIGSSAACALRLADSTVSRRHCAVWLEGGALHLEDVGSTNGVTIGTVRIRHAELADRARLRIGATVLEVERVEAAPVTGPRQVSFGRCIGASPSMRRLYPVLTEVAASMAPALIEGESGTGKELLAEVLHEEGPRRDLPFQSISGAAPDAPLRLFGLSGRPGLLEEQGTVFVREIAALPFAAQRDLGALLERRSIARVDGSTLLTPRARLIAGSRRDVDLDVQNGRFDEGLASTLARVRVELPALRMREGDVRLLAEYFWRRVDLGEKSLDPEEMSRLEAQRWSGNVRELELAVARLASGGGYESHVFDALLGGPDAALGEIAERLLAADLPLVQARSKLGEEFDRRYLSKILAAHNGNVSRAAAASGVARRYFQTLKSKHGINSRED